MLAVIHSYTHDEKSTSSTFSKWRERKVFLFMFLKSYWKSSADNLKNVRMLAFIALMIALKIVIGFIRIPVGENLRITLTYIVVAIEGMVVGPVAGMTSAFITDNLSFILFPDGAYFPGYTLTAMLGSLFYSIFLYKKKPTWSRITLAKICNNYLVNVLLGSLWSSMLYGKAYLVYATTSLIKNTVLLPIEIILLMISIKFILPILKNKNLVNISQDQI